MGTHNHEVANSSKPAALAARFFRLLAPLVLLLAVSALIAGFVVWPLSPTDLGKADRALTAGLHAHWQAGDLVVLVRHGERCDRSDNPCLGPADGITLAGREAAMHVGSAFSSLGMANADVLASPLTRTMQTARSMFDRPSLEQDWLVNCDAAMSEDIKAHKASGRNLVLVTHSSCIDRFQHEMGFPYARDSEYASSLFAILKASGKLQVLGVVNREDWPRIVGKNPAL